MATLLFRLNQVPEDEAEDIRQLLDNADLDVYETSSGFWGLGVAAIWLRDNNDLPRARNLIDHYQQQRAEKMRADYQARVAAGEEPGFWQHNLQHPLRLLGIAAFIILIITVMLLPFWKSLHP
jgi:hypothetical protein